MPGAFEGLLFGAGGSIYSDNTAVLIEAATAKVAMERAKPTGTGGAGAGEEAGGYGGDGTGGTGGSGGSAGGTTGGTTGGGTTVKTLSRRFHGTTKIDAADPISSFTEIVQNVIEHFQTQYGTEVTITVDVEAKKAAGFDSKTVRDVRENAKQLGFSTSEFEEH